MQLGSPPIFGCSTDQFSKAVLPWVLSLPNALSKIAGIR